MSRLTPEQRATRQRKLQKERAVRDRVLAAKDAKFAHEPRNSREDLDALFATKRGDQQ
jgi:hypothetical protein